MLTDGRLSNAISLEVLFAQNESDKATGLAMLRTDLHAGYTPWTLAGIMGDLLLKPLQAFDIGKERAVSQTRDGTAMTGS
jgi:hypothetical protein